MTVKRDSYFIEQIAITNRDGETQEISGAVVSMKYYESVLSPSIAFELIVTDSSGGLYNLINIGDKVELLVGTAKAAMQFNDDNNNTLYVRSISNSIPGSTKDVFLLTLTSLESLVNETSRIVDRYSGKISEIVNKILVDNLKVSTDRLRIDSTINNYQFIGNARKPFNIITWLCKKSITDYGEEGKKGSAGYFFYQDYDGYKFVSVDSIIDGSDGSVVQEYVQTEVSQPESKINDRRILNVVFEKNNDLIENLKVGMYSNISYFYNPYSQTSKCYQYNMKNNFDDSIKILEPGSENKIPEGFDNSPSRIMVAVLDQGTLDRDGGITQNLPQDQGFYQSQSVVRYNLIFSQTVSITVACNPTLRIGDKIKCKFLAGQEGEDDVRSGSYIVSELAHQFFDNSAYTGLKLIRDSYGGE